MLVVACCPTVNRNFLSREKLEGSRHLGLDIAQKLKGTHRKSAVRSLKNRKSLGRGQPVGQDCARVRDWF